MLYFLSNKFHNGKQDVFVNTDAPGGNKVKLWQKISKSYILTLPDPKMSVNCEQPLDDLTVQVWLLYDHPNFKYCTLFICRDGITDKQRGGRTIQTLDAPGGPFRRGHKKYLDEHTVNMVIFALGKFCNNVGKTFHMGVIFMILHVLLFP